MDSVVLIPDDLEAAKVTMTAVYGGTVVAVEGSYDDVNRLCAELTSEHPTWAFVNVNVRTYYAEGSKTLAFEVAEQLGWQAPDHVVVPIGSGSQLTKVAKGFAELCKVGLLDERARRPGLGRPGRGLRAGGDRLRDGTDAIRPVKPDTIAKSLAIGNPADGWYALDAIRRSGGSCAAVTDAEVLDGDPAAGPHRGDLRRDGRRGHHRHAGQAGRLGRHPPRRAGRGHGHRPRPEDGRGADRDRRAARRPSPRPWPPSTRRGRQPLPRSAR